MNSRATEPDAPIARTAPLKFALASGSRPLPGYTIKRGVGRGGFGEVYYAVSDAGKEVALKLIRRNLDVELRGVTQCLNLKHPHLLSLHDVKHDDEENCWVIMEYVAGDSLEDALERSPEGLPPAEAMEWMRGIAAGVAYLHDHGIVHRDLKPGNIFNDEGVVKLGDYGLSKFISCSRRSGQTENVGTVHYMAPEIANGRYGREIDIYALGIILYEMLTGRVPFEGESVGEVLMKHLTAEPDVAAVAEPFREVVNRALAKDPAVRFSTVEELMTALPAPTSEPAYQSMRGYGKPSALLDRRTAETLPHPGSRHNEEPIWRWLRTNWKSLDAYWASTPYGTLTKVLLVVGSVIMIARHADFVVPVMIRVTMAYLAYRLVRFVWLRATRQPRESKLAEVSRKAAPERPASRSWFGRRRRHEQVLPPLTLKSPRERLADLLGSLLVSAIAAIVIGLVMVLLRGQPPQAEQYAWIALVGTLGAWGILIPSKFWEGDAGEPAMRRFVMLVVGLALGTAAYAIDAALWVDLPFDITIEPADKSRLPRSFYSGTDGSPLLFAYLAYFGFLFLLVRWWRSSDPLRPTRLSLWQTVSALFVAWILNFLWPFPQPWGFMVTATISIAVQLAAPWSPRPMVTRSEETNSVTRM